MRNAGVDWQMVSYGGAVHSFTNPDAGSDPSKGAAYNEKADRRSWEAMKFSSKRYLNKRKFPFKVKMRVFYPPYGSIDEDQEIVPKTDPILYRFQLFTTSQKGEVIEISALFKVSHFSLDKCFANIILRPTY
jgi:hypothetical protein